MTSKYRSSLLAGAALSLLVAGPALAFDSVDWNWDADIYEKIYKNVDIKLKLEPTGMIMIEGMQIQTGAVSATSNVSNVWNSQPGGKHKKWFQPHSFDAETHLGLVTSAATAVGNNFSVEGDAIVQLHYGQELSGVGQFPNRTLTNVSATSNVSNIGNLMVDSAATAVGNNMSIDIASVEPEMDMDDLAKKPPSPPKPPSYGVDPVTTNRLVIAELNQLSLANVSATSNVSNVHLANYRNLGGLEIPGVDGADPVIRPVVSSVATAVGNNLSVKVARLK